MKNADWTSIASAYDSTKISLSFGMMTSFRLVMPPNTKNNANTNTRRSGASTPAAAAGAPRPTASVILIYSPRTHVAHAERNIRDASVGDVLEGRKCCTPESAQPSAPLLWAGIERGGRWTGLARLTILTRLY